MPGETLQQAVQSAAIGAKSKLEPLADTVKRLGNGIMEQEARRVREELARDGNRRAPAPFNVVAQQTARSGRASRRERHV